MGLCGFLQEDSNSFSDINILGKWGLMGFFKGILNGTRAGEQGEGGLEPLYPVLQCSPKNTPRTFI
jgi:hypothetical protein